jgi:hypothetical protein
MLEKSWKCIGLNQYPVWYGYGYTLPKAGINLFLIFDYLSKVSRSPNARSILNEIYLTLRSHGGPTAEFFAASHSRVLCCLLRTLRTCRRS